MKITNVRAWLVKIPWDANPGASEPRQPGERAFIFVQVDTDAGITGWGEVTTYPGPVANRAVAAYINEIGQWLRGEDPTNIEAIWGRTFRAFTYVGTRGATTAAISAVDIALWDIRGKVLGQPIYQLMGGPVRDRIALYCHPPRLNSPEAVAESAKEIVAAGFKAFKMDPMLHNLHVGNASFLDGELSLEVEAAAIDILAAVREAVGPQIEILIDAHGLYNVPAAVRLANRMAEYNIHWFEEPVPPESWKALKQVKEQVSVRISTGERLHTRWEFVPPLRAGPRRLRDARRNLDGRHLRAQEDRHHGRSLLHPHLAPRCGWPHQRGRWRTGDDDRAQLLQAGGHAPRLVGVRYVDRRAAGRARGPPAPVGATGAGGGDERGDAGKV